MNLDKLLADLQETASDELNLLPLLDYKDFVAAGPNSSDKEKTASHFYVGCFGLFAYQQSALGSSRLKRNLAKYPVDFKTSPSEFSEHILDGILLIEDINISHRKFAIDYIRDYGTYAFDYEEILVVQAMKINMFEVDINQSSYSNISRLISQRWNDFIKNSPHWAERHQDKYSYSLSADEMTLKGWENALREMQSHVEIPEKLRRLKVVKLWSLIDYAPNFDSTPAVSLLISLFNSQEDSSVLQAATNSLREMSFSNVISAIFNDAVRLEKEGWLESIFGIWGKFSNEQIIEIKNHIDNSDHAIKSAIRKAVDTGISERTAWAFQINQLI